MMNKKVLFESMIFMPKTYKHKSDTFVCSNCGRRVILKVYGDTCTCSECGGTMYRQ